MKKKENKNRRNFLLCMGGLLVLIVFAFVFSLPAGKYSRTLWEFRIPRYEDARKNNRYLM